jgi:hypothetical protein
MCPHEADRHTSPKPHCCPCCDHPEAEDHTGVTRRGFLGGVGGAALGGVALTGLSWSALSAAGSEVESPPSRRPLVVKPVLIYSTPTPRPQQSWRSWGGIQTQGQADREVARIRAELDKLQSSADFPVRFLPVAAVRSAEQFKAAGDVASADVVLVYAAGGGIDGFTPPATNRDRFTSGTRSSVLAISANTPTS